MKTRIVHTKIWDDDWFQSLSRASSRLFIYLITCPDVSISGVFELPDRKITFHTGLTATELSEAKKDLSEKVIFYGNWVYIKNIDRFNSYKGPKNEKAREREINYAPKKLIDYIRGIDTSIDTSIHTTLNHNHNHNHNKKSEIRKQKSMEQQLDEEYCKKLANDYKISVSTVISKRNDLILYCKANGKKYKDYQAALQNWLRRDLKNAKV